MARPRDEWTDIPVPAIVSQDTFDRVAQRLTDNKRFASRNSKDPSLLQGLAACSACGYGYYRTSTRTTNKKIYYYRCLGSDDYRYEGGRVCINKPVRADYLDTVVWNHITGLLADPRLIRAEIDKRLDTARDSDPAARQRTRLHSALAQASGGIAAMIEAFGEQLITIDELRARMPDLTPAKPTYATRSRPSTPNSPTARPTSTSPPTSKDSSLNSRARPTSPPSRNAGECCDCWSKTSSSDPTRSPSATASPSGNAPAAHTSIPTAPTRRVTIRRIAQCVGGVPTLPWGDRLRRWRTDVKAWSQQELADRIVQVAFQTKEERGTRIDVRLIGKWENGAVTRPQGVYRRLLTKLDAPLPKPNWKHPYEEDRGRLLSEIFQFYAEIS